MAHIKYRYCAKLACEASNTNLAPHNIGVRPKPAHAHPFRINAKIGQLFNVTQFH